MRERYVISIETIGAALFFGGLLYELGWMATSAVAVGIGLIIGAQFMSKR